MPVASADHTHLPGFLCVGIEKCGTTSLYDLLLQHPDIGLSSHKETHFFNNHWDKGLDWYLEKFSHVDPACKIRGEITPAYHRFPEVIPRIQHTLGKQVKIIIMLREPRQRAFSHYVHDFSNQLQVTDLVYKRYLTTTRYAPVLREYFDAFGRNNCLVLIHEEDMLPDPQRLVNLICDFLGLQRHTIKPVHSNPSCLPVACWSPDHDSRLPVEDRTLIVPARSVVVFTGAFKNTRILAGITETEGNALIARVQQAVSFIPALKSSIIFEQNVEQDLVAVEALLGRRIVTWRKPLGDLQARFAPLPVFLPVE